MAGFAPHRRRGRSFTLSPGAGARLRAQQHGGLGSFGQIRQAEPHGGIRANSSGDNVGFWRWTQCTRAGCRAIAVRIIVVLPHPASPISKVMPAVPNAIFKIAQTFRCESVRTKSWTRRQVEGPLTKTKTAHIPSSANKCRARQRDIPPPAAQYETHEHATAGAALPRLFRLHDRHDGEHRQGEQARHFVITGEAGILILSSTISARPKPSPTIMPVMLIFGGRTDWLAGASRVNQPEILAALRLLEIRRHLRVQLGKQILHTP